jgi:hypothetical protein
MRSTAAELRSLLVKFSPFLNNWIDAHNKL